MRNPSLKSNHRKEVVVRVVTKTGAEAVVDTVAISVVTTDMVATTTTMVKAAAEIEFKSP